MGMSDDFEAAVEEGATLVRVGSAIFGGRLNLPVLTLRAMRPAYRLRWAGPPGWRRIPPVTRARPRRDGRRSTS